MPSPASEKKSGSPSRLKAAFGKASPLEKTAYVIGGVVGLFLLSLILALFIGIVFGETDSIAEIVAIVRDLVLILLAVQAMLLGIALIVLVLQLAAVVNLLQNEIDPVIRNLQDTSQTVKGTSQFLSENLTAPVIESKAWVAALRTLLQEIAGIRQAVQPVPEEPTHPAEEPPYPNNPQNLNIPEKPLE
jgi:uncharacterized protein YoxC